MKRKDAKAQGLQTYNTGKVCKNGHISERYTLNGNCVQCQRDVNSTYVSPKLKEHKKKYYETHKEEISIKNKEKYKSKK